MRLKLAYGKEGLWVNLPEKGVTVIEPRFVAGLPDESAALRHALLRPIGSPPLRELVRAGQSVAIVFPDLTRPMPHARVLPVLLAELEKAGVARQDITLINALGTHRANTPEELIGMLGRQVYENYAIIQHDAFDPGSLTHMGRSSFGHEVWINSAYLQADVKILTGFIEPHLFAGFSGGPKAVLPGLAGERAVLGNHDFGMVAHPQATWGITRGNPLWEEMLEIALLSAPTFLLNVTINKQRQISGVFAGDLQQAHAAGVDFVRQSAMVPVPAPFDIVITTNSGYPLDLNLYQAVKGMSAAAQVVKTGGSIIAAAECWDGVPEHGQYKKLLHMANSPQALLDIVSAPGFLMQDQWEAQVQAQVQLRAEVYVRNSYLSDDELRRALFMPCHEIEQTLAELMRRYGPGAAVCVLPEGPQTIPYLQRQQ
ncbi:MAG: nickel-dependent lactate racemase [Chloroflexota bacterium]